MKFLTHSFPGNGQDERTRGWTGALGGEEVPLHDWSERRETLLELREDILKSIHVLAEEAREETPNYSLHMADAATDAIDRDISLGLASFEQESLYEIDAALARIEEGTYGLCELTGHPIPLDRLEAIPWARFSLEAQKGIETNSHPHVGVLRRVRREEKDKAAAA